MQIDLTHWRDAWAEAEASGNALSFIDDLLAQVIDEVKRHQPYNPDTPEDFYRSGLYHCRGRGEVNETDSQT